MGHNQVLTSTVMHAITMQELLTPFTAAAKTHTSLLDVGCGKGYSTLAYSMLASQFGMSFAMTGLDYHHSYMEKAYLNLD
jgi:protein-L-isoaspartate O-methyltransferase